MKTMAPKAANPVRDHSRFAVFAAAALVTLPAGDFPTHIAVGYFG
jgi:hypothetical protein